MVPSRRPAERDAVRGDEAATPRLALSVVIPCYNEADGLTELHRRLTAACRTVTDDYELILVNDGSTDRTWQVICALAEQDSRIVGIRLSRNHGHQLALTAGLSMSSGERVLVMDADLQDPPELLPDMARLMDEGADIVYGKRRRRMGETAFKRATAAAFYRILNALTDVHVPTDVGDFRLMSRRVVDILNAMPEKHRFVRGMVSWVGFHQAALTYDRAERHVGETKYPFRKMVRFAIDAITGFSIVPLRIASYFGFMFGLLAILPILYTFIGWLSGETVAGWTSLMAVTLVIGSVQLIVTGILGEYIGRIYIESKQRPLFIIDSVVMSPPKAAPKEALTDVSSGELTSS